MIHPSDEQLLDFVLMDSLDDDALKNAAFVTGHIAECGDCLKRVQAFNKVYDELVNAGVELRKRREAIIRETTGLVKETNICLETEETVSFSTDNKKRRQKT